MTGKFRDRLRQHPDRSIDDKFERLVAERDDLAGALAEAERERDAARRLATLTAESQQATAQILQDTRAEVADAWIVPKIQHDENRAVGPRIHGRWIHRATGQSDPEHTRHYAALLLAAADEAERRMAEGKPS